MDVWIDFETRSFCDLTKRMVYNYSRHPTTGILCMAYAYDDEPVQLWTPDNPFPVALKQVIDKGAYLHAWNAPFEKAVWNYCAIRKYGFPKVPLESWRCTMAKAAHANLPQSLDGCGSLLLPHGHGKDKEGHALMMKMCKPVKIPLSRCACPIQCECTCPCPCEQECQCGLTPTGKKRKCRCETKHRHKCVSGCKCQHHWIDDDESLARLYEYCKQDVVVERELDKLLPEWPESEVKVWQMNERLNDRGVPIDVDLCEAADVVLADTLEELSERVAKMTDGEVTAGTQVQRIKHYVNERGVNTDSLDRQSIENILSDPELPDDVVDILHLRQAVSGAAAKKYKTATEVVCTDDRARGLFRYYGASATGRMSSTKLQLQNFKKPKKWDPTILDAIQVRDMELLRMLYGGHVITLLGSNVRAMVCAEEGNTLIRCDSSQVEARILAVLSGNEGLLEQFSQKRDPYIEMAQKIFNKTVRKDDDERKVGKVAVLSLGYGSGAARFKQMVKVQTGLDITESFCKHIVDVYRKVNHPVCQLWRNLDAAAFTVIEQRRPTRVGLLTLGMQGEYLTVRLPSGRRLFFYKPGVDGEGRSKKMTFQSSRGIAYEWAGGLLTAVCTQATARDTLIYYMANAERKGLDIIATIHDEAIVECSEDEATDAAQKLQDSFDNQPAWASDWPLACEVEVARRYIG